MQLLNIHGCKIKDTGLGGQICNFHFVTLCEIKFGNFSYYETVIWVILEVLVFALEEIPHLEVLKFPNFHFLTLRSYVKAKFDNLRKSKSAILVILEDPNFDF